MVIIGNKIEAIENRGEDENDEELRTGTSQTIDKSVSEKFVP